MTTDRVTAATSPQLTVGDMRAGGHHGVIVHCNGCNYVATVWWSLTDADDATTLSEIARRLICTRCRVPAEPALVRPYQHRTDGR